MNLHKATLTARRFFRRALQISRMFLTKAVVAPRQAGDIPRAFFTRLTPRISPKDVLVKVADLEKRLALAQERLAVYEAKEKSLARALLDGEKVVGEIVETAKAHAEEIVNAAQTATGEIVHAARSTATQTLCEVQQASENMQCVERDVATRRVKPKVSCISVTPGIRPHS